MSLESSLFPPLAPGLLALLSLIISTTGNYYDQIYQALAAHGANGEITLQYFCARAVCTNGGNDRSDNCAR
ncbi:hypothetical protein O9K51_09592 [Purpureocillium lavendulum]|uniref:Uncharacterized protein n=1 Tax=Purpureocillium lavendulum TaxID=1247861 RepID=A0AB34FGE5_9HYPO|nr:hypothetical protein O9K51_09592 [Purpureocillium lavendulum]